MDRGSHVGAQERLYGHHEGDFDAWFDEVGAELYALLGQGAGALFYVVEPGRCRRLAAIGLPPKETEALVALARPRLEQASKEPFCATLRRLPVVHTWRESEGLDGLEPAVRALGAEDLLALATEPIAGTVVGACFGLPRRRVIPRSERAELRRLALHLEVAARALLHPDSVIGRVHLEGRVEPSDLAPPSGVRVSEPRPEHSAALWHALTAGTLSLLERATPAGTCVFDLVENASSRRSLRALSTVQLQVVDAAGSGLSNKEIAHEVGVSESYASQLLGTAARTLGARNSRLLLQVLAALSPVRAPAGELTAAERAVFELLARGYSNQAIAAARGVHLRTVANQVAAVLAKTGSRSRRALLGRK